MIGYIVIVFLSLLAGRGALALADRSFKGAGAAALSPCVAAALWIIVLNLGALLRVDVKIMVWPIWGAATVLAIPGARALWREKSLGTSIVFAATALAPLFLLLPYVANGLTTYPGSPFADRWWYASDALSLWNAPGAGALDASPILRAAAGHVRFRIASALLLAFFSPIVGAPGDPLAASGVFLAWTLFLYASASAFFILAVWKNSSPVFRALAVAFTVFAGWPLNAVMVNNYDNLLSLFFIPALTGFILAAEPERRGAGVVAGLLVAGLAYAYLEGTPFMAFPAALALIERFRAADGRERRALRRFGGFAVLWALVPLLPAVGAVSQWTDMQSHSVAAEPGMRPGEGYFPFFCRLKTMPAAFLGLFSPTGFAPETGVPWWNPAGICAFLACLTFGLVGVRRLLLRGQWAAPIALAAYLFAACVSLILLKYDYFAYKFLLMGWCFGAAFIVFGADALLQTFRSRAAKALALAGLLVLPVMTVIRIGYFDDQVPLRDVRDYLRMGPERTLPRGGLILVDMRDPYMIPWGLYALREADAAVFGKAHQYFPQGATLHDGAPVAYEKAEYVLSDDRMLLPPEQVARIGRAFILWKLEKPWALIEKVAVPYGADVIAGRPLYWLGRSPGVIEIFASQACTVRLSAFASLGPEVVESGGAELLVTGGDGVVRTVPVVRQGPIDCDIPVEPGNNVIHIQARAPGLAAPKEVAYGRRLLIGLGDLVVRTPPAQPMPKTGQDLGENG